MNKGNIRRLERVARLLGIAEELIDRVTDTDSPSNPSDAFYLRMTSQELNYTKRNIEAIAKVAREEQTTPTP